MKYTKASEFLANNNEFSFLYGAFYGFFRVSDDGKFIYTQSTYKKSKFANNFYYQKSKKLFLNSLNHQSEIKKWHKNKNK
ncbi:MAG: hypothetical protein MR902_07870 [Campylobacter sp.]|nr:hypothetical protein [Campylobacter sp.]